MQDFPSGSVIALLPEGVEIPVGIRDLESFRAWASSDFFPEGGRIDWVGGRMEVDMSPEDLNAHGTPKSAIATRLGVLIQEADRGAVFIDRARISCPEADLSAEPDVLVLLFSTLKSGKARRIPRASGAEGRFIEIEGTADLVVECVSDASVQKDRKRLRERYHRAGIPEYWIVDARGQTVSLQLLVHREAGYEPAATDAEGYAASQVLGSRVRLVKRLEEAGLVLYRLEVK
jgi:Uma2 family endonuclease